MSLLEFSGLEFGYTHERVITDASGALQPGEVVGLVGANGCGKTTLIRLLLKQLAPERGNVQLNREADPPAYVSQADQGEETDELFSFVRSGRSDLLKLELHLKQLPPDAVAEAGELQTRFEALGGHQWDNDVEKLLTGLSFNANRFSQRLGTMSGGQRQKACIARALNRNARLLVFDEPTNHLDLSAQEFFVNRVKGFSEDRAVLLVSHDRWLLDALCSQVWELEGGVLYRYQGNYSRSLDQRRLRRRRMRSEFEKQQEQIARTEDFIRRNIAGQNTRQARGRRKLLNRMERLEAPQEDPQVSFALQPALTPGHQLLIVENLAFAYGKAQELQPAPASTAGHRSFDRPGTGRLSLNPPMDSVADSGLGHSVIEDVAFTVYRGERLGIIGPNGCGKSTLLMLLARHLSPGKGMIAWGTNVELGIFHQDSADLSEGFDLLAELRKVEPGISDGNARDYLARFGFSGDDVFDESQTLSGGERSRLSLAKIFRRRPNVLLFDEPTNHLDIYAREALEQLLLNYQGSLVMVTHDRALLERVCDRLVVFEERLGGAGWVQKYFRGSYPEYLKWSSNPPDSSPAKSEQTGNETHAGVIEGQPQTYTAEYLEQLARQARTSVQGFIEKQLNRLKAKAEVLESDIERLENRVTQLEVEQRLADSKQEYGKLEAMQCEIDDARELIEDRFSELEEYENERQVWQTHAKGFSAD